MSRYIQTYLSSIPEGQRKAIQSLLSIRKSSGEVATSTEYKELLAQLLPSLQKGANFKPSFNPELASEEEVTQISSDMLNKMFESIYLDLQGLYTQLNNADATITAHAEIRKADWSRIRDALNKVAEDLVRYQILKTDPSWQDVKCLDLWNRRIGEETAKAAVIDPETRSLTLNTKSVNRLEQELQLSGVTAEIYEISPINAIGEYRDFEPKNALDQSDNTFWARLLLYDNQIDSTWDSTRYDGALIGYTINFANTEFINHLSFLPFAKFPIKLIDLQYRDGDTWASIPGFVAPTESLDWTDIRFQRIQANALRLILQQKNYVRNRYLVPRNAFNLTRLWDQILDEELLLGVEEEDLTDRQKGMIETNPRFRTYTYALKRIADRLGESGIIQDVLKDHERVGEALESITSVLADTKARNGLILQNVVPRASDAPLNRDSDLLEINKVEYLFGLRTIRIHDDDYLPIGIYRSPKFVQKTVPYQIAVEMDESHVDLGGYYGSSVDLEVEVSPDRRHNIVPYGDTSLTELVIINPKTMKGQLRFTPSGAVSGRIDNKVLVSGVDFSVSTRTITILQGWNPNYRYVFTYTPSANQDIINIDNLYNSVALEAPEVFDHTDAGGMISLSYYPYIAYEIINNNVSWTRLPDEGVWTYRIDAGNITVDGVSYGPTSLNRRYEPIIVKVNGVIAQNVTDYINNEFPRFRADPERPAILQYIQVGRNIYLSRPLSSATIEVQYNWMVQYIQVIATLRSHGTVVNPYTPTVSGLRLLIRNGK